MKVSSIKRIVVLSLAIVFLIFSFQHNSLFVYADEDQRPAMESQVKILQNLKDGK